ncbi:MAG TPA: DUF6055 domain-containing protein [Thermoanaerobaculia bacterium]|nr:DUF6055 domain-containing protein [Thermoanaerobaculia bacterium]
MARFAVWLLLSAVVTVEAEAERRRAVRHPGAEPTSGEKIAAALAAGRIDADTAYVYQLFVAFGDCRLPAEYHGAPPAVAVDVSVDEGRLSTLPPDKRALVDPYLRHPRDPQSWYELRDTFCGNGTVPVEAHAAVRGWKTDLAPSGSFRVTYDEYSPDHAALAATVLTTGDQVIWPFLKRVFAGREPLQLNAQPLELVLLDYTPGLAVASFHHPPGCGAEAGYITINVPRAYSARSILEDPTNNLLHVLAHEITHAFTSAYPVRACDDEWIVEATAEWAAQRLYPDAGEHDFLASFFESTHRSLSFIDIHSSFWKERARAYGAWIFLWYLERHYGGEAVVTKLWSALPDAGNPLVAIHTATGEQFEEAWHGFAVALVNEPPFDELARRRNVRERAIPRDYATIRDGETEIVDVTHSDDLPLPTPLTLHAASIQYHRVRLDDANDRSVAFANGMNFDLALRDVSIELMTALVYGADVIPERAPVMVRTIAKVGGKWQPLDDSKAQEPFLTWCRDQRDERISELLLVFSYAEFRDRDARWKAPGELGPRVRTSDMACWRWSGPSTTHLQLDEGFYEDATGTFTWTREAPEEPVEIVSNVGADSPTMRYLWGFHFEPEGQASGEGYAPHAFLLDCQVRWQGSASANREQSYLLTFNFVMGGAARRAYVGRGESHDVPGTVTCPGLSEPTGLPLTFFASSNAGQQPPQAADDGSLTMDYTFRDIGYAASGFWSFTAVRE